VLFRLWAKHPFVGQKSILPTLLGDGRTWRWVSLLSGNRSSPNPPNLLACRRFLQASRILGGAAKVTPAIASGYCCNYLDELATLAGSASALAAGWILIATVPF
jgi:hypothetical protein